MSMQAEPALVELELQPLPERPPLGGMLVRAGWVTDAQLQQALAHQRVHGGRIGSILVTLGYLEERQLGSALGQQLGVDVADVESVDPAPEVLRLIPESLIRRREVIPLLLREGTLVVGATDPSDPGLLQDVRFRTGIPKIELRLVTEHTFRRFLQTRFASPALLQEITADPGLERLLEIGGEGGTAAVNLVDRLLALAVRHRASDVHVEPFARYLRVRLRVDGRLYTALNAPLSLLRALVSRVKILAGMDISRQREPQDGHLVLDVAGESRSFRVSTLPTVYGEKCVIRLLRREDRRLDLTRLGLDDAQIAAVRELARRPQGLILVTGPTGSGKTTTLHAILDEINEPDCNIITVEDPVEATIPGINHVQVSDKGGVSFAGVLRSILRQDPDVVMVGEMRDLEVAQTAIRAALTGHLVLSTLHTNGVVESITRLVDMGLESYLIGGSLNLIVAQRLLRRLCSSCASTSSISAAEAAEFELSPAQLATAHHRRAVGCSACLHTGYRGRLAVYEVLIPDAAVRQILREGGAEHALLAAVKAAGATWMRQSAVGRVLAGETTWEEARRVPPPPV